MLSPVSRLSFVIVRFVVNRFDNCPELLSLLSLGTRLTSEGIRGDCPSNKKKLKKKYRIQ